MRSPRNRSLAAGLLVMTMSAGIVGAAAGTALAAYSPSAPPYTVAPNAADANAVTTLHIYDASTGAVVTSGSNSASLNTLLFVSDKDFGTADAGSGRKAALFGFLAENGKAPGAYSGKGLGAATTFPVTTAPAPVNGFTTPTARGGSTNTFADLAASYPNTAGSTSDFFQLYQVRVKTTFPTPQSAAYSVADIKIDTNAGTWSLVGPTAASTTTLGVTPASPATTSTTQTLTATVAPQAATGSVQFLDGTTPIGSPVAVSSGTASTTTTLSAGTHSLSAVFTPSDAGAFTRSTSAAQSYDVTGPPSAPSGVTAAPGNTTADVSWTAPSANGSAISGYTVSTTPTSAGCTTTTATSCTLSGLANGTAYSVTVTATNGLGTSPSSAPVSVTPRTLPGAPTNVTGARGNASATVSFTAPASDGGAAITKYTVTSTPGGATATGTASPVTVPGLTNGTAYTFTIVATNAAGEGPASAASPPVTPAAVPSAPSGVTATPGNGTAAVAWTASNSNGSSLSKYSVTATPASGPAVAQDVPSGTSTTLSGLSNGTTYSVVVTATNGVGTSPASAPVSVTPRTTPGAPTGVTATPGNTTAGVAFTAPASTGGSAISGYTVTAAPGGATGTGTASPITVSGLTNGTAYTFTVVASNAAGPGPASAASAPVTPASVPGAPTAVSATSGDTTSDVAWTAPASSGGSAVTGYTVTATPSSGTPVSKTTTGTSTTLTGLVNGTTYSVSVTATNAVGSSPASAAVSITPFGAPAAPGKPTGTAGNGQVSVAFTVSNSSNGATGPVSYTVTASPGGATFTGTSSPIVATGLTNGQAYTFTVTATNDRGTSPASPVSDPVTPGVKVATTTTLVVNQAEVLGGRKIAVRGSITGITAPGVVTLRSTTRGATQDTMVPVRADGRIAVDITATKSVTFRLIYTGDSGHQPSLSATKRTVVFGGLSISKITPAHGRVSFTGTITPGQVDQAVTVFDVTSGRPVGVVKKTTDSAGRFTIVAPAATGLHRYRLQGAATASNGQTNTYGAVVTVP